MELPEKKFKSIVCTLDYPPQLKVIDKKGEIISFFIKELPHYTIVDDNKFQIYSADRKRSIIVTLEKYGYATQIFDTIEAFAQKIYEYSKNIMPIIEIGNFTRVGVRIFYEIELQEYGEYPPLKKYYDIPGINDERLNDLIHYQVSFEAQQQRIVITLGQNKRDNRILLIPDIHGILYKETSIEMLCDTIKRLYHDAHQKYEQFTAKGMINVER